jgi:hypothetical protein
MESDARESEAVYPNEPETRVKKVVHSTLLSEFGQLVQTS